MTVFICNWVSETGFHREAPEDSGHQGYFLAMSSTGPCPDTSTHLSWYFLNIRRGLWDIMTWSCDIYKSSTEINNQYNVIQHQLRHLASLVLLVWDRVSEVTWFECFKVKSGLTGTPSMWDSWSAFFCRKQLPAFVTKTSGSRNCPWASSSFWKALLAAGMGVFPRTRTPSMSNSSPKLGSAWSTHYSIKHTGRVLLL